MTPLDVEILMHYYWSPGDFPNHELPAQQESIKALVKAGLLCETLFGGRKYYPVKKGVETYVKAVLAIPLPVQIWVIPENDPQP